MRLTRTPRTCSASAHSYGPRGPYVGVQPEEVVRVVLRFEPGQTVVVARVCLPDPVVAVVFAEFVGVDAAGDVRLHALPGLAHPRDVGFVGGGILPERIHTGVNAAAMRVRRRIDRNAARGAVNREEEHG